MAFVTLVACIAATLGGSSRCPSELPLLGNRIGTIRLGMSVGEIESGPYSFERTEINIEGEIYPRYAILICPDVEVIATLDPQDLEVYEVRTSSQRFARENGAHVGMTLSELRQLFPDSRISRGYADGLYFVLAFVGSHDHGTPVSQEHSPLGSRPRVTSFSLPEALRVCPVRS